MRSVAVRRGSTAGGLTIVSLALALLDTGCATAFHPLVTHRIWENRTKEAVFDAAVRALHEADFLIATSDRASGLIGTDWKRMQGEHASRVRVRINLLVLGETDNTVALSFKSVVQVRVRGDWQEINEGDSIRPDAYERLTRTLDDFFLEVQRYCGPSVQRR